MDFVAVDAAAVDGDEGAGRARSPSSVDAPRHMELEMLVEDLEEFEEEELEGDVEEFEETRMR